MNERDTITELPAAARLAHLPVAGVFCQSGQVPHVAGEGVGNGPAGDCSGWGDTSRPEWPYVINDEGE